MYSRIVVPLDGSKLAEVVLPHLEKLIGASPDVEVFLVSVTEKIEGRVPRAAFDNRPMPELSNYSGRARGIQSGMLVETNNYEVPEVPMTTGRMAKAAQAYLENIADGLKDKGCKVNLKVLVGKPADEIMHFAEDKKAEAIMIASRGKSGLSRWDLGNIAEKIIRSTNKVVILVKPEADFKETKAKRKGSAELI